MPPKKPAEPSKKTEMKKKEKIIEVIVSARCKVTQALRLSVTIHRTGPVGLKIEIHEIHQNLRNPVSINLY